MTPKHNRKLLFSGIDLVGASMKHDFQIMEIVMDEYEKIMIDSHYLDNAKFSWIGISWMYGLKYDQKPSSYGISKKYGDLSFKFEIDMRVFLTADEEDINLLKEFFEIATLDCLIHVGKKYKLPIKILEERRELLGVIPVWEDIYNDHPNLMIEAYEKSKPI